MVDKIDWDKHSLIPAIAQDYQSGKVLMLAYMDKEALELTIEKNIAHYYSRSKQRIWQKGESSGNIPIVKEIFIDCDNDTLLLKIEQVGDMACHTGRESCFFKKLDIKDDIEIDRATTINYSIIDRLFHIIEERKRSNSNSSYVVSLFNKGENSILKKVIEEAGEFSFAVKDSDEREIIYEAADLAFHVLVALSYKDVDPDRVKQELLRRFGTSGIEEKNSRESDSAKKSKDEST